MSLNHGSAILVMICTLMTMMLICSSQWFRLTTALETVLVRKQFESRKCLTQALLDHAISLCCDNYDQLISLLKEKKEITTTVYPWPPYEKEQQAYTGIITVTKNKAILVITSSIKNTTGVAWAISCNLERDNNNYVVSSWSRI